MKKLNNIIFISTLILKEVCSKVVKSESFNDLPKEIPPEKESEGQNLNSFLIVIAGLVLILIEIIVFCRQKRRGVVQFDLFNEDKIDTIGAQSQELKESHKAIEEGETTGEEGPKSSPRRRRKRKANKLNESHDRSDSFDSEHKLERENSGKD